MGATDLLKREHKMVLQVLDRMDREVAAVTTRGRIDAGSVAEIMEFLQSFLDRCHQEKEEHRLFPRVERTGISSFDIPLAILRREHEEGRERIRSITAKIGKAAAGNGRSLEAVREELTEFFGLLRKHMAREEEVLFPLVERSLTPMDQDELVREFQLVDETETDMEKYRNLARKLSLH
jgi:hemerythrin-like domain-containing protein